MKFKAFWLCFLFSSFLFFSACNEVSIDKKHVSYPAPIVGTSGSAYQDVSTNLLNLATSEGSLAVAFSKDTLLYNVGLGYNVTSVKVTPTAEDLRAVIKVNGTVVSSGSASELIPTGFGTTEVNIAVERPDGSTQKLYKIVYSRLSAYLSSFTVSTPTLSFLPTFDKLTAPYVIKLSNNTDSITFKATTEDPTSTMTINGEPYGNTATITKNDLAVGDNAITVAVTNSQLNTPPSIYSIVVRRVSNDAGVSSIEASYGSVSGTSPFTIVSPQETSTNIFPDKILYNAPSLSITVNLSNSAATATLNGSTNTIVNGVSEILPVQKYTPLQTGASIVVTAEDGTTTKTYDVRFNKEPVVYLYSTVNSYDGNLGGSDGAKTKCTQDKPSEIPSVVCSTIRPIINTVSYSLSDLFPTGIIFGDRKFVNKSASRSVANNATQFLSGNLDQTLAGTGVMGGADYWWTAAKSDGTYASSYNCSDFTSNANTNKGFTSLSTQTKLFPLNPMTNILDCSVKHKILCACQE